MLTGEKVPSYKLHTTKVAAERIRENGTPKISSGVNDSVRRVPAYSHCQASVIDKAALATGRRLHYERASLETRG